MREHGALAVHDEDRSLKQLVSNLGQDMGLLVRQEVQLAKTEITEKVSQVAKGGAMIGVGAFMAYVGLLALAATLVLIGIAIGIVAWLSALIVTVLFLLVGWSVIQGGRTSMTEGPPPLQHTKTTTQETVRQLKEQL
jgi:uncharacterized membrane protein YqjE